MVGIVWTGTDLIETDLTETDMTATGTEIATGKEIATGTEIVTGTGLTRTAAGTEIEIGIHLIGIDLIETEGWIVGEIGRFMVVIHV